MTGKLITYENIDANISCYGEAEIINNCITQIRHKGKKRIDGKDRWMEYYEMWEPGDYINNDIIDFILGFNGANNIVSKFVEN